ncbi:hypothetical protein LguiB_017808 [Lonicera macranthoides]
MGNHSQNFSCIGIGNFRSACKLVVWKRHSRKKLPLNNRFEAEENLNSINKPYEGLEHENQNKKAMNCVHNNYNIDKGIHNRDARVDNFFRSPSKLSRSSSDTRSRSLSDNRSTSGSSLYPLSESQSSTRAADSATTHLKSVSRSVDASLTIGRGAIMYSNSNGLVMKPPAMEKKLECTLEELCFGCIKKIKIRRDVIMDNGQMIQEEEVLTVKIKPGWTIGTKITFEGMGNETPGAQPADIIFVIEEKRHHLFTREGDDLELAIEIPLVKALTGCALSIPLLGGENMSLKLDDIVYPGYEKIIEGQGMLVVNEQGKRGNLVLRFLVTFPEEMTEEQRSDVYSILEDCCDDGNCSPYCDDGICSP